MDSVKADWKTSLIGLLVALCTALSQLPMLVHYAPLLGSLGGVIGSLTLFWAKDRG